MTLHTPPVAIRSAAERIAHGLAFALGGSLLLAVSAKVQVPFYPVPLTLQTLVVLLLGATLGARLAAASVALYLDRGSGGPAGLRRRGRWTSATWQGPRQDFS